MMLDRFKAAYFFVKQLSEMEVSENDVDLWELKEEAKLIIEDGKPINLKKGEKAK